MYQKSLEALSVEYIDCPQYCATTKPKYDVYRFKLCDTCPKQVRKNKFQRAVERSWEEWLGGNTKQLKFSEVFETLQNTLSAKSLPDHDIPSKVGIYLSIYDIEKARNEELSRKINNT